MRWAGVYGPADTERRAVEPPKAAQADGAFPRSPFERDRARVLHSYALRRLAAKTQVVEPGAADFPRTRLTHSLECAQIGRELGAALGCDPDLVDAACLAHDLGHPPFGHNGERALDEVSGSCGGFEGNAQTLRLLTEIIYSSEDSGTYGMSPTRAFMDGVLKYKTTFSELEDPVNHFMYDEQKKFLNFVFPENDITKEIPAGKQRDNFRSIECQIMDWSDDVAY